jgi:hypothetical protein
VPPTGAPNGRLTTFGFVPGPASTAPPTLGGVLPVIAGVLPVVDGVLIDGVLTTGADGMMGAGVLPVIEDGLPVTDGVLPIAAGGELVTGGAATVVDGVVPVTDGVVPTGDGVLPLTLGAGPDSPPAGALLVCARAGNASATAVAIRHVRIYMGLPPLDRDVRIRLSRCKGDATRRVPANAAMCRCL